MKWVILNKDQLVPSVVGNLQPRVLPNGQALIRVNKTNEEALKDYKKYTADDILSLDLNTSQQFDSIITSQKVSLLQQNPQTGAVNSTPRYSKPGMLQRIHESEWETCIVGGRIHDRDHNNQDTGWSSVEFYKLDQGSEVLMVNPTQNELDTECIRTDFHWEPNVDYMVLSGELRQKVVPSEDVYFWGLFANVKFPHPVLPIEVLGGGMNLAFNEPLKPFGMKGVSASSLYKDSLENPEGEDLEPIFVGPNMGTNRISFKFRHPAGFKHRINAVFGIFR